MPDFPNSTDQATPEMVQETKNDILVFYQQEINHQELCSKPLSKKEMVSTALGALIGVSGVGLAIEAAVVAGVLLMPALGFVAIGVAAGAYVGYTRKKRKSAKKKLPRVKKLYENIKHVAQGQRLEGEKLEVGEIRQQIQEDLQKRIEKLRKQIGQSRQGAIPIANVSTEYDASDDATRAVTGLLNADARKFANDNLEKITKIEKLLKNFDTCWQSVLSDSQQQQPQEQNPYADFYRGAELTPQIGLEPTGQQQEPNPHTDLYGGGVDFPPQIGYPFSQYPTYAPTPVGANNGTGHIPQVGYQYPQYPTSSPSVGAYSEAASVPPVGQQHSRPPLLGRNRSDSGDLSALRAGLPAEAPKVLTHPVRRTPPSSRQ